MLLMELISKFNKKFVFYYVLCRYAWVIPLKDRKGIKITNAFENILN